MIRKLIVLLLSIITLNAHSSTGKGLKEIFDEFNYAMTVEWDQKDQSFHDEQLKKLTEEISQLQATGLSQAEMVELMVKELKSPLIKRDLERVMTSLNLNLVSEAEARDLMLDIISKDRTQGASWSAEKVMWTIWGTLFKAISNISGLSA